MIIRPSSALRNEYNEIAKICKEKGEPVFLTVNGREDTVILSVNEYKKYEDLNLMYRLAALNEDIQKGETISFNEVFSKLNKRLKELRE